MYKDLDLSKLRELIRPAKPLGPIGTSALSTHVRGSREHL
jgi:hypothetical protein